MAGRAEALLSAAILDAERTRLSAAGDIGKTTWGCVLLGLGVDQKPDTVARARDCLEAAAQREPSNANVWEGACLVIDNQRLWGWGLPPEEASVEKRVHLADRELQAALRAHDLAPLDSALSFTSRRDTTPHANRSAFWWRRKKRRRLIPTTPRYWDPSVYSWRLPVTGTKGTRWPKRLSSWRGHPPFHSGGGRRRSEPGSVATIQEAYEAFQRAYIESFWLSHLDLAYTLPFLGRVDEAKQHVAALLKMYPTMTIREADAFYKLVCFDAAYREKMAGALRQAGLPE